MAGKGGAMLLACSCIYKTSWFISITSYGIPAYGFYPKPYGMMAVQEEKLAVVFRCNLVK